MEALQWCEAGNILPSGRQVRGEEIREEEEEEVAKWVMVSTISFIQANLQHSIAVSGILTRTPTNMHTRLGSLWKRPFTSL